MELKKLPIGVHEFPDFHSDNLLYIDKTQHIHRLVTRGKYYFMSRPRRFGKSLLLSTLKCLFQGRKELFQGLWIEDKWDWSVSHPVLHLSFISANTLELGIEKGIHKMLEGEAKKNQITLKETSNGLCFQELIHKIHEKQGKVVILIDEYDKAIVDYLDDKPKAYAHRDALKSFYEVLKNNQEYIHFVFLTGVTKFSKVSLFSALNHLSDISFSPDYNDLVGYTQQELEFYFKDYIVQSASKLKMSEKTLLRDIKKWYNGYNWTGKNTLYNPFSILGFFQDSLFKNFWFSTGTPTFLTVMAREQSFYDLDSVSARQTAFDSFDIDDLDPQAVMFQTGYLTIKNLMQGVVILF
ncbi:MAG: AAA family ATPase [Saprospiraceae bacterium]|nr:AAA family ATPase [Saprospiraceae bacterium]